MVVWGWVSSKTFLALLNHWLRRFRPIYPDYFRPSELCSFSTYHIRSIASRLYIHSTCVELFNARCSERVAEKAKISVVLSKIYSSASFNTKNHVDIIITLDQVRSQFEAKDCTAILYFCYDWGYLEVYKSVHICCVYLQCRSPYDFWCEEQAPGRKFISSDVDARDWFPTFNYLSDTVRSPDASRKESDHEGIVLLQMYILWKQTGSPQMKNLATLCTRTVVNEVEQTKHNAFGY